MDLNLYILLSWLKEFTFGYKIWKYSFSIFIRTIKGSHFPFLRINIIYIIGFSIFAMESLLRVSIGSPEKNVLPLHIVSRCLGAQKAGSKSKNRDGTDSGFQAEADSAGDGATLARVDFCIFLIALALVSSELAHKSTVMDWLSGPLSDVRVNCQPSSLRRLEILHPPSAPWSRSCLLQAASVSISNFCSIRFIWLTVRGWQRDPAQCGKKQVLIFDSIFVLFFPPSPSLIW